MLSLLRIYCVPLVLGVFCVVLMFLPDTVENCFSFQRSKVIDGEWWRLLTANFFHLNVAHLLLNILGAFGIWFIFSNTAPILWQVIFLIAGMLFNTFFVLLFDSSTQSFVGLSGALHGVFVGFCIAGLEKYRCLSLIGLLGIMGKIMLEQLGLSGEVVERLISNTVIIDAHLWGAVGGLIMGVLYRVMEKQTKRERSPA